MKTARKFAEKSSSPPLPSRPSQTGVQREDFLLFYVFLEDRLGKVEGEELVASLWPGDTSKNRQKSEMFGIYVRNNPQLFGVRDMFVKLPYLLT